MAHISKATALLALLAASPTCDAFAPGPRLLQRRQASVGLLSASSSTNNRDNEDDNAIADGWMRKASGSAAAFMAGMGIMAQLAMADTTFVVPIDPGEEEGWGHCLAEKIMIVVVVVHSDASQRFCVCFSYFTSER
jgi:hypothetical protein